MSHYVYRYFDAADRLIYIGCSKNPWKRYRYHRADSREWIAEVARATFKVFPSEAVARVAERAAIIAEKPIYNIQHRWENRGDWNRQDYIDYALGLLRTNRGPSINDFTKTRLDDIRMEFIELFGERLPVQNTRPLRRIS